MTRLRIGLRSDVPALKVMGDDADDPWATDNGAWAKFRFNSEVAALPYAKFVYKPQFFGADWDSTFPTFYPVNTSQADPDTLIEMSPTALGGGQYVEHFTINANRIFGSGNENALHYCRRDASDWVQLTYAIYGNYPAGAYHYRTIRQAYPGVMFLPAIKSGVWSILGNGEADQSSITDNSYGWNISLASGTDELGQSHNASYWQSHDYAFALYQINLPVNEDDYPATVGTPAPDKKILRIAPGEFKLAKPGFDVDSATGDQLIINSDDRAPLAVVKTGSFTLAAGSTQSIDVGFTLDPFALVDYQVNPTGSDLWLPPLPVSDTDVFAISYKISGTTLQFKNDGAGSVDIRYFVMAQDTLGVSSGSAKVFENADGHCVFRKPNTAGTNFGDVLFDTNWSYLPIVDQGWVPLASFSASDNANLAKWMYSVSLDNDGSWKPYVIGRLKRQLKSNSNNYVFKDFLSRRLSGADKWADSTFMAKVTDTLIKFYCNDGSEATRLEAYWQTGSQAAYLNTIGMRYYVLAVPNSL